MDFGPVDKLIGRILTHQGSLVGRDSRASFDNFVVACNEVLFRYDNIRESAIHHAPNLLEAFQAGSYRHSEVVGKVLMEEMRNSVDIVFVLENACEFSDDSFVYYSSSCMSVPFLN